MPLCKEIKKVLVIGSGPIVIGQAAEFDYAGAQACRVLKQAGINVVLVNSNPATIMTDKALADEIYLEPLNTETLRRIILREQPDSLLAGLGGQTGLTLAMQLSSDGFLQEHGVRLLGTDAAAIDCAEDRELFKKAMERIGQPTVPSDVAHTAEAALAVAERIGYPVIVRPAAAWRKTRQSWRRLRKTGWMPPPFRRFWWNGIFTAGRRSSLKPCGTRAEMRLPCAAWRLSLIHI